MKRCKKMVDVGRRRFLKGGAIATAGVAASTIPAMRAHAAPANALVDYPSNRLANVSDLAVNEPLDIDYPDADSPGALIKLGRPVEGGVGPDRDIVAFSTICPHRGYGMSYNAEDRTFNCPGHFSRFDAEAGGQQVWGHATQNLPQFILRVDEKGDIYAEGATDLIFGRPSNIL